MKKSNVRVLLVDDNRDAVDMVSQLLNYSEIDNKVAYDGAAAIRVLAEWPADVVFLDIQMPGINGYDTAVAMHDLPGYADLPIVAWSGWDGAKGRDAMLRARLVNFLPKPFTLEQILELIRQYSR